MREREFQSARRRDLYQGQHGGQSRAGGAAVKKSTNQSGQDVNVLSCKSCMSFRHPMTAYSHSWENMPKVIACTAQEEECVLFTGYQRKEIHLEMESRNCAVIDSACSSRECGTVVHEFGPRF